MGIIPSPSFAFGLSASMLWLMGCVYNLHPIRTKDIPYIDVLSESLNNPIRLALGWHAVVTDRVPPLSLILAYWMIGAFFMAISIVHLPPMKRAGRTLLLAVAGFGVATIIFGYSRNFWLSVAMLCLIGAFDNISMVVRHTLVQLITPDRMRGRITAVNGVFVSASNELGGFESGTVAHFFGPVFSVISGGIGTLVVVLTTALASPRLRTYGALDEIKTAEEPAKKNAADD